MALENKNTQLKVKIIMINYYNLRELDDIINDFLIENKITDADINVMEINSEYDIMVLIKYKENE